jgi:hypothetical protein
MIYISTKLLHLFDTCTHLTDDHLSRHSFVNDSRLLPAVNDGSC